jgi:predicted O-methyltransferase YrrM
MKVVDVVRNATAKGHMGVVWHKVLARLRGEHRDVAAVAWCEAIAVSENPFPRVDAPLWTEADSVALALETDGEAALRALGFDVVGSGAHCALLYFLARWIQPATVLETGVAAGYSSAAILTAIERNGRGHLYSSDFPYLRIRDPARHIGCLVPDRLRRTWTLEVKGDRVNLPRLLAQAGEVGLFHYDSDKSYSGRKWAFARVIPRLASSAVVVIDDVQDNLFFRHWVESRALPFVVLRFRNKFVGVAGRRLGDLAL